MISTVNKTPLALEIRKTLNTWKQQFSEKHNVRFENLHLYIKERYPFALRFT